MPRLNDDLQKELEPQRMAYAKEQIESLGFSIEFESEKELRFKFHGSTVALFPYSGWHSGKTIKDGRGIHNLLKQIK